MYCVLHTLCFANAVPTLWPFRNQANRTMEAAYKEEAAEDADKEAEEAEEAGEAKAEEAAEAARTAMVEEEAKAAEAANVTEAESARLKATLETEAAKAAVRAEMEAELQAKAQSEAAMVQVHAAEMEALEMEAANAAKMEAGSWAKWALWGSLSSRDRDPDPRMTRDLEGTLVRFSPSRRSRGSWLTLARILPRASSAVETADLRHRTRTPHSASA